MLCRLVNKVMHFSHMRPSGVCLWVNARKFIAAIVKVIRVVKAIMIVIVIVQSNNRLLEGTHQD